MNKAILMGRITKDIELRYVTTNNTPVCNFSIAVDRKFQKAGEERQADFINIIAWNKTAEFASKCFSKGMRIALVGSIQTRTWEDADGKKHYATDVVADEVFFADAKKDQEGGNYNNASNNTTDDDELPF
jgi:single-strand DNA-binding protein